MRDNPLQMGRAHRFVDIGWVWPWRVTCHDIRPGGGHTELCTCDGRNEICCVSDMLWSNKWHQQLMQLTFCCLPNCNSRDLLKLLRETCLGWRRPHEKIFRAMALITHWQIAVSETQRGPFKSQSVSISERAVSRHKLFYNDLFCRL